MDRYYREVRARMVRGLIPNGLLADKKAEECIDKILDLDRWSRAEERAAQLIAYIQPTFESEQRRQHVVSYLQRLINNVLPCRLFPLGSVPLRTYLPDGDIDLTAFGDYHHFDEDSISEVLKVLQSEQISDQDAEFRVRDVQYIQAEVKIIKCLVKNFVVDISFSQAGGLCTLCFLEEVDNMIGHNHLFKRSILLVKAWCYYESRILGAQHGLMSTYALETLVMYIFHVYNGAFVGPLEVLYRFLEFFSNFDWNNYCISLRGPVPIDSLPNLTAEKPRKDCPELLLNEGFLHASYFFYGAKPYNLENAGQTFASKYINIIDPLRVTNNLGRSISKGNFFRIKSAISFGAEKIVRLLDCPEEKLIAEIDFIFKNTWERNGNGFWIHFNDPRARIIFARNSTQLQIEDQQPQDSQSSQEVHQNPATDLSDSKGVVTTSVISAASEAESSKTNSISTTTMICEIKQENPMESALVDQGQSSEDSSNEVHDVPHSANVHTSVMTSDIEPTNLMMSAVVDQGQSWKQSSDNQNIRALPETQQQPYGQFGSMQMHREQNAIMNSIETYRIPSFNGFRQPPVGNVNTGQTSRILEPSHYHHVNAPYFDPSWGQNTPCRQDLVPLLPAMEWFRGMLMSRKGEQRISPFANSDGNFWLEQNTNNLRLHNREDGNIQPQQEASEFGSSSGPPIPFPMKLPFPMMLPFPNKKNDILEGDFLTHLMNMRYAMHCLYGPPEWPMFPPPMQPQFMEHSPWQVSPGTLPYANKYNMAQSFPIDPMIPIMPPLFGPRMGTYQLGDAYEPPKNSTVGIGTYIPDPESYKLRYKTYVKDRNFGTKSWRINYSYDRNYDDSDESEKNSYPSYNSNERFGNHGQQMWRRVDRDSPPHFIQRPGQWIPSDSGSSFTEQGEGSHNAPARF